MAEVKPVHETVCRIVEIFKPGSCYTEQWDAAESLLNADREAARLEGKRELLAELRTGMSMYEQMKCSVLQQMAGAILDAEQKYTPATETQPDQDGERRQ